MRQSREGSVKINRMSMRHKTGGFFFFFLLRFPTLRRITIQHNYPIAKKEVSVNEGYLQLNIVSFIFAGGAPLVEESFDLLETRCPRL